jgi:hypothetical protein
MVQQTPKRSPGKVTIQNSEIYRAVVTANVPEQAIRFHNHLLRCGPIKYSTPGAELSKDLA